MVTNSFYPKDLSRDYANIISLEKFMPEDLAAALVQATQKPPLSEGIVARKANNVEQEQRLIEDIVGVLASDFRPIPVLFPGGEGTISDDLG